MDNKIYNIYQKLYKTYGSQGWWPILSFEKDNGYHKDDYSFPRNDAEVFEVCIGSILTQNTTFNSVIKSLTNLNKLNLINAKYIDVKILIENELQKKIEDNDELVKAYQEFHALIVCHGKMYYSKKPYGGNI